MARKIIVKLPVKDVWRSVRFFSQLGFCFDGKATDDTAACLIVSESIRVMLLAEALFRDAASARVWDATAGNEVLVAVSLDNRVAVDQMIANALAAGGTPLGEPQDRGVMYRQGFRDPDGHLWEVLHVSERAVEREAVTG
jgi:uncharacterized protein